MILTDQGIGVVAAAVVTHAPALSTKHGPVYTGQLSPRRVSKIDDAVVPERSLVLESSPPGLRAHHGPLANRDNAQPSRKQHPHKGPRHNRRSVAYLRRSFEQEYKLDKAVVRTTSLPNTPERAAPRHEMVVAGSCPRWLSTMDGPSDLNPSKFGRAETGIPAYQYPNAATIRHSGGRALRESLMDELAQTLQNRVRGSYKTSSSPTSGAQLGSSESDSAHSQPVLISGSISGKAHTVRPKPWDSARRWTSKKGSTRDWESSSEVCITMSEPRKTAPGPSASPYLQHWRTRQGRGSLKSTPSLPIIVSATISASMCRGVRRSSSLVNMVARRERASEPQHRPTQALGVKGFRDAVCLNASRSEPVPAPVSPIRNRIYVFEQIGRVPSTDGSCRSEPRHAASSAASTKQAYRPRLLDWERSRTSQTPQSLSFSGSHKSSVTKAESESQKAPSKPRFPLFTRHNQVPLGRPTPTTAAFITKPKREPSFSFRTTLRKISKSHRGGAEARLPVATTAPRPRAAPSTELLNKTASIAPRALDRIPPGPARTHPNLKSQSAFNPEWKWEAETEHDSRPSKAARPPQLPCRAGHTASSPTSKAAKGTTKPDAANKTAAAAPLLNPASAHGHARDLTNVTRRVTSGGGQHHQASSARAGHHHHHNHVGASECAVRSGSVSWGRRAAAAALDIGRRFKGRRVTSSSSAYLPSSSGRVAWLGSVDSRGCDRGSGNSGNDGSGNGSGGDSGGNTARASRRDVDIDRSGAGIGLGWGAAAPIAIMGGYDME